MQTISAPINRLVHMNIYALSATHLQGLEATPLLSRLLKGAHATGEGHGTVRRTRK